VLRQLLVGLLSDRSAPQPHLNSTLAFNSASSPADRDPVVVDDPATIRRGGGRASAAVPGASRATNATVVASAQSPREQWAAIKERADKLRQELADQDNAHRLTVARLQAEVLQCGHSPPNVHDLVAELQEILPSSGERTMYSIPSSPRNLPSVRRTWRCRWVCMRGPFEPGYFVRLCLSALYYRHCGQSQYLVQV
jgi:hypothetical protein